MSGGEEPAAKPHAPRWLGPVHLLVALAGIIGFHETRVAWGRPAAIAEGIMLFIAVTLLSCIRVRYA